MVLSHMKTVLSNQLTFQIECFQLLGMDCICVKLNQSLCIKKTDQSIKQIKSNAFYFKKYSFNNFNYNAWCIWIQFVSFMNS